MKKGDKNSDIKKVEKQLKKEVKNSLSKQKNFTAGINPSKRKP